MCTTGTLCPSAATDPGYWDAVQHTRGIVQYKANRQQLPALPPTALAEEGTCDFAAPLTDRQGSRETVRCEGEVARLYPRLSSLQSLPYSHVLELGFAQKTPHAFQRSARRINSLVRSSKLSDQYPTPIMSALWDSAIIGRGGIGRI